MHYDGALTMFRQAHPSVCTWRLLSAGLSVFVAQRHHATVVDKLRFCANSHSMRRVRTIVTQ